MAKIAIVIPILNNFKGAVETIQSVRTKHAWTPILVPQWRKRLPLAGGWNEGIGQARDQGFEYILVVNDDILFSKYTIDNLVDFFENSPPEIVMITGCNVRGAFDDPYNILTWEDDYGMLDSQGNFSENPDFSCFMIRHNFTELVGPFDENFKPAYFEDNDMHYRINVLGYKAGATSAAPYYHFASMTRQNDPDILSNLSFEDARNYYIRKWGGTPSVEQYRNPYDNPNISAKDWAVNG